MRRALIFTMLGLFLACGSPKRHYTFPGCEDAGGGDDVCADLAVFECAERTLQSRFDACTASSDCSVVSPRSCIGGCTVALNAADVGAYRDEEANEAARFCKENNSCGGRGFGTACVFTTHAVCTDGRCTLARFNDGG